MVKKNIDWSLTLSAALSLSSRFLVVQRILFIELLLDQHLILFVYLNQQLLIYNYFLCNHNLTNILKCNLHLVLLLIFYFLHIVLYLNQLIDHKVFSIDDNIIIFDYVFWYIIFSCIKSFSIVSFICIN